LAHLQGVPLETLYLFATWRSERYMLNSIDLMDLKLDKEAAPAKAGVKSL
jgi:hypothetical protein